MPLIGRAWKANVNGWKRHLTLQSVFNHGECMMHMDKNADGHVVDQNVDRILREIAYVPLGGGIRSKRSSCMQIFFILFFWMSTRYAYLEDDGSWLMFSEDKGFLSFSSCFQRTKSSGSLLIFLEDQRFWILAHVFRGLGFWGFGSYFQRTKGSGSWLMFSKA